MAAASGRALNGCRDAPLMLIERIYLVRDRVWIDRTWREDNRRMSNGQVARLAN
jgi:hypothetical protein